MIDVSWNIPDEHEAELTGAPRPLLGTWHYLSNSLRREWRTWVAVAAAGAAIGLAVALLAPPGSQGTVTILMAHPANLDGPSAISTDVSLLDTREVAALTVRRLNLDMTPEAFQQSVSADPVTSEILTITVSGPDNASAVARANAVTSEYLDFRASQLRSLSRGLIDGYQSRISDMQAQVAAINRQYAQLSAKGAPDETAATDLLTQRSQLNSRIYDMQQAISDAALGTDAAVSSTHVIDAGRPVQQSRRRSMALDLGSGLIAGLALGVGFVLFRALTSYRVRRRADVATALGAPVRFSVASPEGRLRRQRGRFRRGGTTASPRGWDLEALVCGLESAVPSPGAATPGADQAGRAPLMSGERAPSGVALAAIGNARVGAAVTAALGARLAVQGRSVFLVDLSASGALAEHVSSSHGHRRTPRAQEGAAGARIDVAPEDPTGLEVFRPAGVPMLAPGPWPAGQGAVAALGDGHWRDAWRAADVVLVLAEVDPGIDAENLRSWVTRVVPLVTAGRSSPELLETTADLIRAAGLALPFAMMVGTDDTDESFGAVDTPEARRGAMVSEL